MARLDTLDDDSLWKTRYDLTDAVKTINEQFKTKITPENGYFGVREIDKGFGITQTLGRDELGRLCSDYFQNGTRIKSHISLGNHEWAAIDYDDNSTPYLTTVSTLSPDGLGLRKLEQSLTPNTTIVKDNYSAVIDELGRPVRNKITDIQLRPDDVARKTLSKDLRDDAFLEGDDRGHIIADFLGGPATKDNVVAQLDHVNKSDFKRVENIVKQLREEGHDVEYEVKLNYKGADRRPSSFEPSIIKDGERYELPKDLKKIYNTQDLALPKRAATTMDEHFSLSHELGLKTGIEAFGITLGVSAAENIACYLDGTITAEEMAFDIANDAVKTGAVGYGSAFATSAVSKALSTSGYQLIQRVGSSCAPAMAVSFAVTSYGDLTNFAEGKIDGVELAYKLGENAVGIGGSAAGAALAGAAVGSVAGPVGTAVGGIVGSVVGCAVATEVYAAAVELGSEGVETLGNQVSEFANQTVHEVSKHVPEQLDNAKAALNDFFSSNRLPFSV